MQRIDGRWVVSPQDLVAELECDHRVALNAARVLGNLACESVDDPMLDLLSGQGREHERRRLEELPLGDVRIIATPVNYDDASYRAAWQATEQAMCDEVPVIYQATLYTGDFLGYVDFLALAYDESGNIERGADGRAVYEPIDAKSATSAKRTAALQVGAYAEALVRLGWPMPKRVHLWLARDENWHGDADRFAAAAREVRERLQNRLETAGGLPDPIWAAQREACTRCDWATLCKDGRREDRDLSLVQGIRSTTRDKLIDAGIATIDQLATVDPPKRPNKVSTDTFEKLRAQAALQVRAEKAGEILFEVVDQNVLDAMPTRDAGDIWFDMEGFPQWLDGRSLEYMFGYGWLENGEFKFHAFIAHNRAEERIAFVSFVDEVMARRAANPGMHVYHYANYERAALLSLAQRHGVRENEVDQIVREKRLVDLFKTVRTGLRFSTESLSLKYIEPVYGRVRDKDDPNGVISALGSVIEYDLVMQERTNGHLAEAQARMDIIKDYNEVDCQSTMELDDWLRKLPGTGSGTHTHSGVTPDDDDSNGDFLPEIVAITEALKDGLPEDPTQRTPEQQARALLAAAVDFHRREERPQWWQMFEWSEADDDSLRSTPAIFVPDHVTASGWGKTPRQKKLRRTLTLTSDSQEPRDVIERAGAINLLYDGASAGAFRDPEATRGFRSAKITTIGDQLIIEEMCGANDLTWSELPIAVLPDGPVSSKSMQQVLTNLAKDVTALLDRRSDPFPRAAWTDLLLGAAPRRDTPLPRTGDDIADIVAALKSADSYVAVQGPPGTGKTYVGSHVVAALAADGWRIGVVAQSHAVVENFLDAVVEADPVVAVGKKAQEGTTNPKSWHVKEVEDFMAVQTGGFVIGGTVWSFCRDGVRDTQLDLLVIDEAGQFSLANSIAAGHTMRAMLLLGDPQQLPQVSQATHPEPVQLSVLEHVSAGNRVMPADRGYFLASTYRMHPLLAEPVSRLQYDGRLHAAPVTSLRHLESIDAGITAIQVPHEGNTTSSIEEAREVVRLAKSLLGQAWIDAKHDVALAPRPLAEDDLIVVAAYNAQVRLIRRLLAEAGLTSVPVGTVDKFQGREAPVVIVSLATSSGEDLPRGIDFLLSPNRLNVAVSRGKWACLLVHSPALRAIAPGSVEGLNYLGAFLSLTATAAH